MNQTVVNLKFYWNAHQSLFIFVPNEQGLNIDFAPRLNDFRAVNVRLTRSDHQNKARILINIWKHINLSDDFEFSQNWSNKLVSQTWTKRQSWPDFGTRGYSFGPKKYVKGVITWQHMHAVAILFNWLSLRNSWSRDSNYSNLQLRTFLSVRTEPKLRLRRVWITWPLIS